ncbi:hypothetical protein BJY01DRAFT_245990 [Aspergillus pseudoustus]|uniref:DUF8035 domain-containing protein n=1 Tax=Aspergillus pseudoustus TaxID=1810923 RepID=A0ABR4KDA6_9EURO
MPRRSRPVGYDDIAQDIDHGIYPSRVKGGPIIDQDAPYGHRAPQGPYVEILERRHVRDRAQREIPRESYEYLHDGDLVAEKLERLDLDPYPRDKIVDSYRRKKDDIGRAAEKSRGRPRSRGMSEMEDAYYSTEESDEEYESESNDVVEPVQRQKKRSISRHEYEARKNPIPRSKNPKERKRIHRSTYEEEVYPKSGSSREDYMGSRRNARHDPPRPQHRSHYHVDIDDIESDESDESEDIRREQRTMSQKESMKSKYYPTRKRDISPSSPSSLSSTEDLSESELPKVPLPVPVPPFYNDSGRKHKHLNHAEYRLPSPPRAPNLPQAPVPPRVPDLETVLNEREARQRLRKGRTSREGIEIERRSKESLIPAAPEPPRLRKEDAVPVVIEEPRITGHRDTFIEDERTGPHIARKREVFEEDDFYRRREPRQSSYSSPSSDTMDGWAIIQAPKMKHTEKELIDIREEARPPKQKHRRPKLAEKDERELEINNNSPHGKVGRRYIGVKDSKERLWTEITKDLVVKEAIERAGYEYEEMDSFYYIFSNLHPNEVSDLIEESDEIRRARRRRLQEIHRERASVPPSSRRAPTKPAAPPPPPPERVPSPPRYHREDRKYRDDRRRREREREEELEEAHYRAAHPGRW